LKLAGLAATLGGHRREAIAVDYAGLSPAREVSYSARPRKISDSKAHRSRRHDLNARRTNPEAEHCFEPIKGRVPGRGVGSGSDPAAPRAHHKALWRGGGIALVIDDFG
jgi:hypothetical protein